MKSESTIKNEKRECIWKYLPQDNRSFVQCIIEFLDTTGGRDKVIIFYLNIIS
jgi:hypothetical protein